MDYSRPLTEKEWAKKANIHLLNRVVRNVESGDVQIWAEELCNIIPVGSRCLEIGCGTGISSLWLAKNGREAMALDYAAESIELVDAASKELNLDVPVIVHDATKELPYEDKYFDYIFQCGLLEHFDTMTQIELLKLWKKKCRKMISMIPNASSLAYRIGKQIMEENGTWSWGLEIPKSSLRDEFSLAGLKNIQEFSIGSKWALKFLPEDHYLKKTMEILMGEGFDLDDIMQGYLLVTIGDAETNN